MIPASAEPLLTYYLITIAILYVLLIFFWMSRTKKRTYLTFIHSAIPWIYLGLVGASFIMAKNWENLLMERIDVFMDEYTVRQIILGYTRATHHILLYTAIFLVYLTFLNKKKK